MSLDRRIKEPELLKILNYIFEKAKEEYPELKEMSEAEKTAALENVAKDFMEKRNGNPIDPDELNHDLMHNLTEELLLTVARDKAAPGFTMTKEDLELIENFKKPEFKPTPEQSDHYQKIKDKIEEICKEVKKILKLDKKDTKEMAQEVIEDPSFTNLFGLLSPNSPIPVPVTVFHGVSGIIKQGPNYETSNDLISLNVRMSDTSISSRGNIATGFRFLELGDESVYDQLKKEGIIGKGPAPTMGSR